jgi:uncharacterized membrane protein YkvA (DUF1232 family)
MRTITFTLIILAALYAAFVLALYLVGKRSQARAISGFIPDCIILFKNLMQDKQVSRKYKLVLSLLIGYLVVPIDLVPDFIPVAGQLDDAIIVALVLRFVLKGVGPEFAAKHWPGPESSLNMLLKVARLK